MPIESQKEAKWKPTFFVREQKSFWCSPGKALFLLYELNISEIFIFSVSWEILHKNLPFWVEFEVILKNFPNQSR